MARTLALAFAFSVSLCVPVSAHDIWVQQFDHELVVVSGHGGGTAPCNPYKIREFKAFDTSGALKGIGANLKGKAVIPLTKDGIVAATAYQEEGFRSITPDGEKPLSKRAVKDAIETRFYQNYLKTLLGWSPALGKPLGAKFELVPLKNPLALKSGETFPLVVYYNGKPFADALVDDGTSDGLREKTDGQGRFTVTVGKKGRQVITAYRSEPYQDQNEADLLSMTTNLNYIVK